MGLISFLKGAGEKVFGWDTEEEVKGPSPAEIAAIVEPKEELKFLAKGVLLLN